MIERHFAAKQEPLPLTLAAGQRIVTPRLDPVLGWLGGERARVAQALIFPQWLLDPSPTENVVYACNLPACLPDVPGAPVAAEGALGGDRTEAEFFAISIPGGQIRIVLAGGEPGALLFRWTCLAASASGRAVWRCYAKLRTPLDAGSWMALAQDYVFDAASGFLVNGPTRLRLTFADAVITLTHPEGRLTCFPAQAGRVKICQASADGWAERELENLLLYPERSIVASFSDGEERLIAVAAAANTSVLAA